MRKLICKDFIGRWSITRNIHDEMNGENSIFLGEANIKKEELHFHYKEQGKLSLSYHASVNAAQSYFWRPVGNSVFEIFFNNGDYFHQLDLTMAVKLGIYCTDYLCISDLYKVQYNFSQFPDWRTIWHVTGPRKKYQIYSCFKRI